MVGVYPLARAVHGCPGYTFESSFSWPTTARLLKTKMGSQKISGALLIRCVECTLYPPVAQQFAGGGPGGNAVLEGYFAVNDGPAVAFRLLHPPPGRSWTTSGSVAFKFSKS